MRMGPITTDIIKNGLVFNMDAANRASYIPDATTSFDTINPSSSGSLENGINFLQPPISASCWDFDGTDDYVDLGNNDFGLAYNKPLSISAWVNQSTSGQDTIVSKRDGSGAYKGWEVRILSTREIKFLFSTNGYSAYINTTSTTQLNMSTWYHVVVTYDGSVTTGGFKIYINGVAETVSSATAGTVTSISTTTVASVAARGAANLFFDGNIANVQIYNRALSASEVLHNYNALKSRFE